MSRADVRANRRRSGFQTERLENRTLLSTFTVTTTADSGAGSLRQAILDSNASNNVTANTIQFNINAGGLRTIALASALPSATTPIIIDGYSQPGATANTASNSDNATILISLTQSGVWSGAVLTLSGGGSTVQGLQIGPFNSGGSVDGILITGNGTDSIQGCFIGVDPSARRRQR